MAFMELSYSIRILVDDQVRRIGRRKTENDKVDPNVPASEIIGADKMATPIRDDRVRLLKISWRA